MRQLKWFIGLGSLLISAHGFASTPILSIVPSTISLTTRSDSETSVIYTVTNNSSKTIPALRINPYYQSKITQGLSLQNDGCTNISLTANNTCSFGVVIQGANQPSNFALSPAVCGYNEQVCSTATASNQLNVNVYQITNPAYAYLTASPVSFKNIPCVHDKIFIDHYCKGLNSG